MTSCSFSISFVDSGRWQKSFDLLFTPRKIHHHHHSTCYTVVSLHQCIYTLQHIPEDENFCLICRKNRFLTLLLHCSICRMEHADHENVSSCFRSTFSTFHECTCLLILSGLLPFFQITVSQPHSKSFYIERPTLFPQRHWMTLYRESFYRIVTRHN